MYQRLCYIMFFIIILSIESILDNTPQPINSIRSKALELDPGSTGARMARAGALSVSFGHPVGFQVHRWSALVPLFGVQKHVGTLIFNLSTGGPRLHVWRAPFVVVGVVQQGTHKQNKQNILFFLRSSVREMQGT